MTFGTIIKIDEHGAVFKVEDKENADVEVPLPFSDAVAKYYAGHKDMFKPGAVVQFEHKRFKEDNKNYVTLMKPAQQMPTPIQRSNTKLIDEKLKSAGFNPTGEIPIPLKNDIPDVNVSARDALILQQSCLNRAVEIVAMEYPPYTFVGAQLEYTILQLKDRLFFDCWKKAGYPLK